MKYRQHLRSALFVLSACYWSSTAQAKSFYFNVTLKAENQIKAVVRNTLRHEDAHISVSTQVANAKLLTGKLGTPDVFFDYYSLKEGDQISFDSEEIVRKYLIFLKKESSTPSFFKRITQLFLNQPADPFEIDLKEEIPLIPVAIKRRETSDYVYGFINPSQVSQLSPLEKKEINHEEIEKYLENSKEKLTVFFVTCKRDRREPCTLEINSKKSSSPSVNRSLASKNTFLVSTRAKFPQTSGFKYGRVLPSFDTPQGIYQLTGLGNRSQSEYGNKPYFNIDQCEQPIGTGTLETSQYVLNKLVPKQHQDDYWIHEYGIANALGRCGLRIHANNPEGIKASDSKGKQLPFTLTNGCINMGENHEEFIETLINEGIFKSEQLNSALSWAKWEKPENLGNIILIVKDVD